MGVKKFQVLLVGLLLVLGISTSAMAQITAGITVRVNRPDSGKVVAIGDSIVVTVANTLTSTPDSVYVRITQVSSATDTTTITGRGAIDTVGTPATPYALTAKFSKKATNITTSGGAPTFRASFVIVAGDPEKLSRLAVIATVFSGGSAVQFHGLNRSATVAANPALGNVGDGKMFGIDGQRPVIANVDTVYLDANVRPTDLRGYGPRQLANSSRFGFKAGETMGLNIVLRPAAISDVASGSLAGAVVLVDSVSGAGLSDESKAKIRVRFLASALLNADTTKSATDTTLATTAVKARFSGSSIARKTIALGTGTFGNNVNATAQAFLIDAAGNLSSTTPGGAPTGVTASLTYLIDTTPPTLTSVYPDTTGKRFTGLKFVDRDTIDTAGTGKTTARFHQRPLRWSLSEVVDSMTIKVGNKTWVRGKAGAVQASGADSFAVTETDTLVSSTTNSAAAATGTTYDIALTAVDSVGNTGSKSVTGAILDSTALQFAGQFPRMINRANRDTFNAQTSSVVFALSEPADSVRITYRRLGVSGGVVTTARGQGGGNININLTSTAAQRIDVTSDSLRDQNFYSLQLFGRDLAYNWTVTGPDTLFYNVGFKAPNADTIQVVVNSASNDTVVVNTSGTGVLLDVSARDTVLKSTAVTYNPATVMVEVWSADTTKNLAGVHLKGTGLTEQAALVSVPGRGKIKQATLDAGGWVLGARQITVSDTLAQNMIFVTVRDTAKASRQGTTTALVFEAGQMLQYKLMVANPLPSSVADTSDVPANRPFVVNVQPQDKFGNASLKQADAIYTGSSGGNALGEIYLEFASDVSEVNVPAGPQRLSSTSWYAFDFSALPRSTGGPIRIMARTANVQGVASGTQLTAKGTVWIRAIGGDGPPPPTGDQTVAKPDTLIVEDYRGPSGEGDQGGFVLVTFKNTPQHAQLAQYRIWREILVSTGYDTATGKITALTTPALRWVPWAVVDAVPVLMGQPPITRAVVPALDNVATRWAITAEIGNRSSEAATSSAIGARQGKVVFSEESVKETLELLGIQSAMLRADLEKIISPSYDFMQALMGDRKDLLYGRLDLDGLRQVAMRVPEGVRAQTAAIRASDATMAAVAVRAIDNIPPAAVSNETHTKVVDKREVTLTWTMSTDDRVVGFIPYRGYAVPIPGVRSYDVLRGADERSLVKIASLASGSTTFKDVVDPGLGNKLVYRITATDLDNATPGVLIAVDLTPVPVERIPYRDAQGRPVYLMLPETDPSFNLTEDFDDFFAFADSFGKRKGEAGFNFQADVNDDGVVDFDDFFAFADAFGRVARPRAGKPVARLAPVFGVNRDAGLDLKLASERVIAGQPIALEVTVSNATAMKGYGFTLTYDPQKFELVEASAGDQNLLSQGGSTPVFLKHAEPGRVQVANAITDGGAVSGSGSVARLVFNVKGEFTDITRFEIAEGVLVDGSRLTNPAVTLGALNIQTTPTEFALRQNFPNPFNPETTIKYDLAEGGRVELRIYNMVGQVVRTLVNERQSAGRYSIRWDGKDDRGLSVSSGIYFYRLTSEKFSAVKKLMLLK